MFRKVAIVGVGLIGGSIGLSVRNRRLASTVVGIVRKKSSASEAVKRRLVDSAVTNAADGLRGADLVILCAPISVIVRQLKELRRHIGPKTLVIDVGSTKAVICAAGKKALGNRFVGCHPMAGSHETGMRFADANLFRGATCFVTAADAKVAKFWRSLGSETVLISPDAHDRWVAQASHLPHVMAFSLFQDFPSRKEAVANPSIRGLDRLSKSDPMLWADILTSNRKALAKSLKVFRNRISQWEAAVSRGDRRRIAAFIREANRRSFRSGK